MGKKTIVKQTKTDTIKKRALYIYLPTEEMAADWKGKATQTHQSISKFITEHVTNSLNQEKDNPSVESRIQLIADKKKLQEENKDLYKRIKMLETLVERLEQDIKHYTAKPFLQENFSGIRTYEKDLIRLFRTSKEVRKEDLYQKLNINPMDMEATTALQNQIRNLEGYGLIKDIGGKWRWQL